jgi:hypothetical protein
MIKILFLAASPSDADRLRLGVESREIKERLLMAECRDQFAFEEQHAVRAIDLQCLLQRHKPHIVHFSGHGSASGEIILEDQSTNSDPVPRKALARLFAELRDNIRCVVLNACYTEAQATDIVESIDCVVGNSRAIADKSAIAFARSFYEALGDGRSIQSAYNLGCVQIDLQRGGNSGRAVAIQQQSREIIPTDISIQDDDIPKLKVGAGMDASTIVLAVSQTTKLTDPSGVTSTSNHRIFTSPPTGQQIEDNVHHSCFISYSTEDKEFATKLHDRLVAAGVKMWFAPADARGGRPLHEQLAQAIHNRDKLLLLVSEHSMQREWVASEIRWARAAESTDRKRKLFPIGLVSFDAIRAWVCFDADTGADLAVKVREYFVPDFTKWRDAEAFEAAFARLLRDLRYDESPDPR